MRETDNLKGPVEDLKWATRLKANVVTPGSRPRIHGYDVRGELLEHLSLSELMLLTLTGELPGKSAALAFQRAMMFLAPVSRGGGSCSCLGSGRPVRFRLQRNDRGCRSDPGRTSKNGRRGAQTPF